MGRKNITYLQKELDLIKNEEFKTIIKQILMDCSDALCFKPAASSGKYHPKHDLGDGGLLRHTKCVVRNIWTICKMWPQFDDTDNRDIMIAAAILHDVYKYDSIEQEHSYQDHPLKMAEKIRTYNKDMNDTSSDLGSMIEKTASIVSTHMSRWDTDRKGNKIGEKPMNMNDAFCAIADMISAQVWFKAEFDENNNFKDYEYI